VAADDRQVRTGPQRTSLAPVAVLALGTLPLATSSRWLVWLLLVPVACAVWVLRARVVTGPAGLEVCNGLGVRRYPWDAVDGFDVPRRGPVRLLLSSGTRVVLTPVTRRRLPRLLAAAPVPATPGRT